MSFVTDTHKNSLKLKAVQRQIAVAVPPIIAKQADDVLRRSIRNLDGARYLPGTLPVRFVSGELKKSMRRIMINKYAHVIFSNDDTAHYNKYVHDGTRKMRPRRFLGDVVRERRQAIINNLRYEITKAIRAVGR